MQIEAGKYYRTRAGRKVGPMRATPSTWGFNYLWRWCAVDEKPDAYGFGVWCSDGFSHKDPIIAEWAVAPDLTAITTPYGLLDDATREALKAHGGPYEFLSDACEWMDPLVPVRWFPLDIYRVKPQTPKPREWWINPKSNTAFLCRHDDDPAHYAAHGCIHVREVTD